MKMSGLQSSMRNVHWRLKKCWVGASEKNDKTEKRTPHWPPQEQSESGIKSLHAIVIILRIVVQRNFGQTSLCWSFQVSSNISKKRKKNSALRALHVGSRLVLDVPKATRDWETRQAGALPSLKRRASLQKFEAQKLGFKKRVTKVFQEELQLLTVLTLSSLKTYWSSLLAGQNDAPNSTCLYYCLRSQRTKTVPTPRLFPVAWVVLAKGLSQGETPV